MSHTTKRYTVGELASNVEGDLRGSPDVTIAGVNALRNAGPADITFITEKKYLSQWRASSAAAALLSRSLESVFLEGQGADARPVIVVNDAEYAMIRLLELFAPPPDVPEIGVHPMAAVHKSAKIGQRVRIGPHVSIGPEVVIGDGVVLHAGVTLYRGITIGTGTILHANVVVREQCKIGRGVIVHPSATIGADGFGYRPDPSGKAGLLKILHIGNVLIEDGVEISTNTCINSGKFGSTIIGAGTKIDNLCQIGHNCRIGRCCVIAGLVGIAGSVTLGDGVQLGGKSGIADHLTIGSGAKIGANSGVTKDVPAGAVWLGYPADNAQSALRQWAAIRKLPDLLKTTKR